jgi:methionyl-tRNA formyltransferase
MRLAFMGTPAFAVPALDALLAAGHEIAAVFTQPPRPAHRGRVTPSAVQQRAEALGLAVRTPTRLRDEAVLADVRGLGLDAAVVAAYGLILPPPVLAAPRHGCINIHASLLPRWRGAAPVQRAIMAGDAETGITIMQMDAGLDTGPMLLSRPIPIRPDDTAGTLTARLAEAGAAAIVEALARLPQLEPVPQRQEDATHAPKIDKEEARIDWRKDAGELALLVRAMNPAPGAWFEAGGERVRLLEARALADAAAAPPGTLMQDQAVACGRGRLRLVEVQPAGRRAMAAADWLRGRGPAPGTRLS